MTPLSRLLTHFPGLHAAEVSPASPLEPLFEAESEAIDQAVTKRRWEFQAGRHCARQALGALGFAPIPIPRLDTGAPLWPQGVVGSITHTGRDASAWAAAVVGSSPPLRSVGLDAEQRRSFSPRIAKRILTVDELSRLGEFTADEQSGWVLCSFSAKEAVYKAQVPLTGKYLSFTDVKLDWDPSPIRAQEGRFFAKFAASAEIATQIQRLEGRYLLSDDMALTLVVVGSSHE